MLDVSFFLLGLNVNAFNGASPGGDWPLILDFKNGSYTSANAAYTLGQVWESETDLFSGGDLGKVVPGVGLVVGGAFDDQGYRFADAFTGLVQAGPIVVIHYIVDANGNDGSSITIEGYDFPTTWDYSFVQTGAYPTTASQIQANNGSFVTIPNSANGEHKLALLMSPARVAASIDGGAVVGMTNPCPVPFTRVACDFSNTTAGHSLTVLSAAFRDPAEGEAALVALSA